jgi:hypothetical protein
LLNGGLKRMSNGLANLTNNGVVAFLMCAYTARV